MKNIQIISIRDKEIARKYFYDYLKELSKFDPTITFDKNGTPIYNWFDSYWIDKERYPFLFSVDNKFAGFALIRELDAKMYEIAEFYVCPEFRKNNNSIWFANTVISLFEGEFSFSTRIENVRAIKFWDKFSSQFKSFKSSIKDCYKCWFIKTI